MLMEDHEPLCAVCAAEAASAPRLMEPVGVPGVGAAMVGVGGATALLERPTAIPMPSKVTYRSAAARRDRTRIVVLATLVIALLVGVGMATSRGEGPLARVLVDAGLLEPAPVTVPDSWTTITSNGGAFSVELPRSKKMSSSRPAPWLPDPPVRRPSGDVSLPLGWVCRSGAS